MALNCAVGFTTILTYDFKPQLDAVLGKPSPINIAMGPQQSSLWNVKTKIMSSNAIKYMSTDLYYLLLSFAILVGSKTLI